MGSFRAAAILTGFFALTVPLMPVQALLVRTNRKWARTFPHWYHRQVCKLIGIKITIDGEINPTQPVLFVSNHTSWLDIPVLSAVAPVSFVAKKEVGTWPFVSSLARLQRTVFVDRERRTAAASSASEITSRLVDGDKIVLFAEGTSSDGNRVLPFKTSLFGAVKPSASTDVSLNSAAVVQTVAIVYTKLHGIPLGRSDRVRIGWFGDMEMTSHAWQLLKNGPIDVTIKVGKPVALDSFADRKALAARTEQEVRESVLRILRYKADDESVVAIVPVTAPARSLNTVRGEARKWT